MKRRTFISKTSAGYLASLLLPGLWSVQTRKQNKRAYDFKAYRPGKTLAPVMKITPDEGFFVHSFYDVCPWSPSQRYVVVSQLPYQKRKPQWGDQAGICVIDLQEQTIEKVYETKAWAYQVGTNVQWDTQNDHYLYANDIIDDVPVCIRIDLRDNKVMAFAGAKYDLSPDGRFAVSPNLLNMNIHQYGYGVPDLPGQRPVPFTREDLEHEGLWRTDLSENRKELLVPMQNFVEASSDKAFYRKGISYLFHSKYNKQNTRIMQVFRSQIDGQGRNASLFTMDTDGRELTECLSREKWNQKARLGGSGNHPNWHPDGEHIIMNCIPRWLGYEDMLFCQFKYDGSGFTVLSEKFIGSGHPSIAVDSRFLVTDAYIKQEYVTVGNEVPIRLIDLHKEQEYILCTMTNDVGGGGEMYTAEDRKTGGSQHKLDPHPVWSRDYRQLCINGAPEGNRQVFIIDVKEWIT